jgi:acetyl-CoA carboxylase carboxyl transferase subunit beta
LNLFGKKNYISIENRERTKKVDKRKKAEPSIPDGMWIKCNTCKAIIYKKEVTEYKLCPNCDAHFRMNPAERIAITCDEGSFEEFDQNMHPKNPMNYPEYDQVIKKAQDKSGIKEAVVTGRCTIHGQKTVLAIMDSHFMMGSMGSVVGEKITRAVEYATKHRLPIIIFTTSGGARMQEGIISLMQMAKVSEALGRHDAAGLLYVTVLTDPTTGGVTASFAMLGDIILSEPKALIGFAGQRVIKGTIHQDLPEGFQRAEFQLEHGFVDRIVHREKLRNELGKILRLHSQTGREEA